VKVKKGKRRGREKTKKRKERREEGRRPLIHISGYAADGHSTRGYTVVTVID